jgi:UDP-N-acetylmuramate--alanine ligase
MSPNAGSKRSKQKASWPGERIPKKIHMVGIGGIGMSGIARVLKRWGAEISGSDLCASPVTEELVRIGIPVSLGQRKEHVPAGTELLVTSAAVGRDNPEQMEGRRRNLPIMKYAQILGLLMKETLGIAVSGTHGKTTTTAMVAHLLSRAGLGPTFLIGGIVPDLGGSSGVGDGDYFVVEACEYDRSFHNLQPHCAVITNIERDHLDYYKAGLPEITKAFRRFASSVPPEGLIVANGDHPRVMDMVNGLRATVETFGFHREAHWRATEIEHFGVGPAFTLCSPEGALGRVHLQIPGYHNVMNALAAYAVSSHLGVRFEVAKEALESFTGVQRRFQRICEEGGVTVIDDYAHHPTEIRAVLRAARQRYRGSRISAVFQPHQYSRTKLLFGEFVKSFADADRAFLVDIYSARDGHADRSAVHARDLVAGIRRGGVDAWYLGALNEATSRLVRGIREGDVVITMGAGDIYQLAQQLREALESRPAEAKFRR